jgi:large subunit ribosomal protein L22
MEVKATAQSIRIAARKVRLVVDLIRGKSVGEAYAILRGTPRGASKPVEKILKSVVANAEHNNQLDQNKLYIKEIYVGEGKTLKRMQPRSQGRGFSIFKRTSHIYISVAERE